MSRTSRFIKFRNEYNHKNTAKEALKFGIEVLVLKKREEQTLEAVQMECLRNLHGITELDKKGSMN